MVSNTDSMDAVTQYVVDKLRANYEALVSPYVTDYGSAADVYYGDQEKFPHVPSICVDPGTLSRDLQGVSYRSLNNFTLYIYVYYAKPGDNQRARKIAQQVSEAIQTLLHLDPQLGGLVIHGYCANDESGYTYRNNTYYRTNRITFEPMSKTRLR